MKNWLAASSIALASLLPVALHSAIATALLSALPAVLLFALPAHADIAPPTVIQNQSLYRKDIGPTQVDILSEDVRVFVNKTSDCIIKTKYVLHNYGKTALTQVSVPDQGKYTSYPEDHYFIVKMNGMVKKVDSFDPNRPLEMNEYDRYKTARWVGWPLKFNAGQTLTLEVTTKVCHRATHYAQSWVAIPPGYESQKEWQDEAEKKSVKMPLDEINYSFYREELWRSNAHPRKLTLILQSGLTVDNIIETKPAPHVVNNTTLVWNCDPRQDYNEWHRDRMDVRIKYMPSCTNTRLLSIYQKLATKHPSNATIIADMGNVYAHQGRYDKQLALYRQYLLNHKPNTKTTATDAVDSMRKAWATYCDSTGNQKNAKQMIALFNKLIKPPESFYYTQDELNAYKKWIKKYAVPVVATRSKPATAPVRARGSH